MAAPIRKADIGEFKVVLGKVLIQLYLTVWYSDSRNCGYLSPKVRGDAAGLRAEMESRLNKRKALRSTQPDVEYPVYKLQDMLQVPNRVDRAR